MDDNILMLRDLWNKLLLSHNIDVCTEQLKGCGVLEVKILKYIYINSNAQIKDILKNLNVPNSTMTNAINRLTKKELIKRKINDNDLRSFELQLTPNGESAVLSHLSAETVIFKNMLSPLTEEEQNTFVKLFEKIVSQI